MEVNEVELKDRRIALEREIDQLQVQLQQAQQIPLMIASRRGEIVGIDRILQVQEKEKQKNNKPEKQ